MISKVKSLLLLLLIQGSSALAMDDKSKAESSNNSSSWYSSIFGGSTAAAQTSSSTAAQSVTTSESSASSVSTPPATVVSTPSQHVASPASNNSAPSSESSSNSSSWFGGIFGGSSATAAPQAPVATPAPSIQPAPTPIATSAPVSNPVSTSAQSNSGSWWPFGGSSTASTSTTSPAIASSSDVNTTSNQPVATAKPATANTNDNAPKVTPQNNNDVIKKVAEDSVVNPSANSSKSQSWGEYFGWSYSREAQEKHDLVVNPSTEWLLDTATNMITKKTTNTSSSADNLTGNKQIVFTKEDILKDRELHESICKKDPELARMLELPAPDQSLPVQNKSFVAQGESDQAVKKPAQVGPQKTNNEPKVKVEPKAKPEQKPEQSSKKSGFGSIDPVQDVKKVDSRNNPMNSRGNQGERRTPITPGEQAELDKLHQQARDEAARKKEADDYDAACARRGKEKIDADNHASPKAKEVARENPLTVDAGTAPTKIGGSSETHATPTQPAALADDSKKTPGLTPLNAAAALVATRGLSGLIKAIMGGGSKTPPGSAGGGGVAAAPKIANREASQAQQQATKQEKQTERSSRPPHAHRYDNRRRTSGLKTVIELAGLAKSIYNLVSSIGSSTESDSAANQTAAAGTQPNPAASQVPTPAVETPAPSAATAPEVQSTPKETAKPRSTYSTDDSSSSYDSSSSSSDSCCSGNDHSSGDHKSQHEQLNSAIKDTSAGLKNFKYDLQLSALFNEASTRAAGNPYNSYTKACADAVESACTISYDLNSQGFAQQASAIRNLADAMNLAADAKVKSETMSAAFASASGSEATAAKSVTQAMRKAFAGLKNASSATKEAFIKAYRDFKAQPTEAKIQDVAMACVPVILSGGSASPVLIAALVDHVASVLTAECAAAGSSGAITCAWEAIAEDVSVTFNAPAVIQPSVMAAHAQTFQSGTNAVASAAQSATVVGPAQTATAVQAPSSGATAAESAVNVKTGSEMLPNQAGIQPTEPFKFVGSASVHMEEASRRIPLAVLDEIIKNPMHITKDPRGTSALKYFSQIWKNGKLYNAEVVYDKATNEILHFLYDQRALGPLPKVLSNV